MKVDLIRKYRWYIVGLIMSFIMISISLSFCLWDDNSLKSLKAGGGSGDYNEYIDVPGKEYDIAVDKYKDDNLTEGKNGIVNVGDIVTFGKYYQGTKADSDTDKTDLRWIVVDIRDNPEKNGEQELYLLTEKVVAFGSFWNDENYVKSDGTNLDNRFYNQRYNTSTIREWLNSEKRTDGNLVGFKDSGKRKVFNGFLDEAFSSKEQEIIIARTIGSMKGYYGDNDHKSGSQMIDGGRNTLTDGYGDLLNEKVWIPSWKEVYGTTSHKWSGLPWFFGKVLDSESDEQFAYFESVPGYDADVNKIGVTTAFASSKLANYTNEDAQHASNQQNGSAFWWLRSPIGGAGDYYNNALLVGANGSGVFYNTWFAKGGVRPAICLAR